MTQNPEPHTPQRVAQALQKAGIIQELADRNPEITHNAQVVLRRRYLSKDRDGNILEDIPGMFNRVAHNLSQADLNYGATDEEREQTQEKFLLAMTRLEVLPNSPTLMNAGRLLQQLSACFVLPVEDSLDGIFNKVKETALIHKSGGGTGFAFSRLRPEGAPVGSTGGVASGPVSFIRAFDTATDVVKQGGTRRGANMAILHVTHPDVMKFVHSKEDGQNLQNFNISVAATDEFMQAVKEDGEHTLIDPITGTPVKTLKAKELFEHIVQMAWQTGDPGLVFIDEINRGNPNPQLGEIESTNPCFAGGMRLATNRGLVTFEELWVEQESISVITDNRVRALRETAQQNAVAVATRLETGTTLREAVPVFKTRKNWPTFKLETESGYEIVATGDHEIFTPGGVKPLQDLKPGDEVLIQSGQGVWSQNYDLPPFFPTNKLKGRINRGEATPPKQWSKELGELLGWIIADGWINVETPKGREIPNWTVGIMFGDEQKQRLAPKFRGLIKEWLGLDGNATERNGTLTMYYKTSLHQFLNTLGLEVRHGAEKEVPNGIWKAPSEAVKGFLSALFSADGTVNISAHGKSCSVRLASSSPKLLKQVQHLLLNQNILSRNYLRRQAGETLMPDSKRELKLYPHSEQYELVIQGRSRDRFMSQIGFLIEEKQQKVNEWRRPRDESPTEDSFTDRVKTVGPQEDQDVYCTTEPVTNSIVVNGIIAAQCGEQPLLPYESCNLASINLARMTKLEDGTVQLDEQRLQETVALTVHMLDNVIDMNQYPIPEIEAMTKSTRRIGLGIMGHADMLVQMGLRYDSQHAIDVTRYTMSKVREYTHQAVRDLAERRGTFPEWENSIYGPGNNQIATLAGPMRNSAPTTVAPTGTISIIAGVSSGIEPLYALAYERNVMDNTQLIEVNPTLQALAKAEGFDTDEFKQALIKTGSIEDTSAPDWVKDIFRTSHQIDPEWHVRMQAAAQDHVDNAVSKTINFPFEATQDDIAKAYMMAYELKCKGITVYRDGSKENQVLTTGQEQAASHKANGHAHQEEPYATPRNRPRHMPGITERVLTGHGHMYVTVNYDENGQPFEVFGNLGKAGGCDSAQLEAITRLISLALRSRIEKDEIIDQLKGITCCPAWDGGTAVKSSPDAVAIVLERTASNGHQQEATALQMRLQPQDPREIVPLLSKTKCPDCNSPVKYQEGCLSCTSCGWNRCE